MSIKSIGELIEEEVRNQGLSIIDFANLIYCKRNNVYNIFKRNTIDIVLLKRISSVLNRNFFKEIAEDLNIITPEKEISAKEQQNQTAVSKFLEVAPEILKSLGINPSLILQPGNGETPDMLLQPFFITFTIGYTLKDLHPNNHLLHIEAIPNNTNSIIEACLNKGSGDTLINITIDNKTYEQWDKTLKFAINLYKKHKLKNYNLIDGNN